MRSCGPAVLRSCGHAVMRSGSLAVRRSCGHDSSTARLQDGAQRQTLRLRPERSKSRIRQLADRDPQTLRPSDPQTFRPSDLRPSDLQTSDLHSTASAAAGTVNRIAAGICILSARDTSFSHLPVVTHMCVRKLPFRLEQDCDCQTGHCQTYQYC